MASRNARSKSNRSRNRATSIASGRVSKRTRRSRPNMSPGVLADPRAAAWDALLRDPCAGNLTYPCYAGADSGYLVRTVDNLTIPINGSFTPGDVLLDYVFQWTPFNHSSNTGYILTGQLSGTTLPTTVGAGSTTFISAPAGSVRRYRPVASCLKFIPTGPYAKRAGTVCMGYSSGTVLSGGAAGTTMSSMVSLCQRIVPNGSESHEVRWLPTAVDENFTTASDSSNNGAGTVYCVLRGVDGIASSTTSSTISGFIEVVTVWEWVPNQNTSLTVSPRAPLPFNSQQVLSTIKDMGLYLFEGVRSSVGEGTVRAVARTGQALLTAGVTTMMTRAGPMLIRG